MMCLHHQIGRGVASFLFDGAGKSIGMRLAPLWQDANTHSFHGNFGNWIFLYRIHGDEGGCGRNAHSCACTVSGACTSRLSSPYATDAESDLSRPRGRGQCPWRDRKRTGWSAWWRNGRQEWQRHSLAPEPPDMSRSILPRRAFAYSLLAAILAVSYKASAQDTPPEKPLPLPAEKRPPPFSGEAEPVEPPPETQASQLSPTGPSNPTPPPTPPRQASVPGSTPPISTPTPSEHPAAREEIRSHQATDDWNGLLGPFQIGPVVGAGLPSLLNFRCCRQTHTLGRSGNQHWYHSNAQDRLLRTSHPRLSGIRCLCARLPFRRRVLSWHWHRLRSGPRNAGYNRRSHALSAGAARRKLSQFSRLRQPGIGQDACPHTADRSISHLWLGLQPGIRRWSSGSNRLRARSHRRAKSIFWLTRKSQRPRVSS
jgi:hypothetical protein